VPIVRVNGVPDERVRVVFMRVTALACGTALVRASGLERVGAFLCRAPNERKLDLCERRSRRIRAVSSAEEAAGAAASIFPALRGCARLERRVVVICGTSVPSDRDLPCVRTPDRSTGRLEPGRAILRHPTTWDTY